MQNALRSLKIKIRCATTDVDIIAFSKTWKQLSIHLCIITSYIVKYTTLHYNTSGLTSHHTWIHVKKDTFLSRITPALIHNHFSVHEICEICDPCLCSTVITFKLLTSGMSKTCCPFKWNYQFFKGSFFMN